jgi:3-deoxy-D-manno-octulosonic-acid transferase
MENFSEMADQFLDAHAGVQVPNGEQLGKVWVQLIENNAMRERMGKAAREITERNRGATARSLKRIMEVIAQSERPSRGAAANGVNAAEGNKKGSAA